MPAGDDDDDADGTFDSGAGRDIVRTIPDMGQPRARGRWLLVAAFVLGAVASLAFMRPTLVAPVAGDDRILIPNMATERGWTPLTDVEQMPDFWHYRIIRGRVNVLSVVERRVAARAVLETSVDTGAPTYVPLGVLKLLLGLASILSLTALVRSLRCRRPDGALVGLSRPTVLLCTLAGGILFALGSQPQLLWPNGTNAWVSYPTHAYGAVVSIFGVVALVLWLTRLYAERRHRVLVVLTLVVLGVVTNFRYELGFPAVPLAALALLLVPVTPADRVAEGRRAKWVTGLAYVGVFLPIFAATRLSLRSICETSNCYVGVTPRLSTQALSTFGLNVVSSIPGVGAGEAARFVTSAGTPTHDMFVPTVSSVLVALAMGAALVLCWRWVRMQQRAFPGGASAAPVGVAGAREEARMLATGAVLLLLGALAEAAVMSVSVEAQNVVRLGLLYRHSVVTWAGLAWALLLVVLALGRRWPRAALPAWLALALSVSVVAAVQLPAGERSLVADRTVNAASISAFHTLLHGDVSSSANASRCRLVPGLLNEPNWNGGGRKMVLVFGQAFHDYWGHDFCRPGTGRAGTGTTYEKAQPTPER